MDDVTLDDLLEKIAPSLADRTVALDTALKQMSSRPNRRLKRWQIGAFVSLGVILASGTTAAIASPSVREWLGWTPDWTVEYQSTTGESCKAAFQIDYHQYGDGQAHSRDEVYTMAVAATERLDLSRRGITDAVDEYREALQSNTQEWDDMWLTLPPAQFEDYVVGQLMADTLHEEFTANNVFVRGLKINNECDRGAN